MVQSVMNFAWIAVFARCGGHMSSILEYGAVMGVVRSNSLFLWWLCSRLFPGAAVQVICSNCVLWRAHGHARK